MATETELRYNVAHWLDAYKGIPEGGTKHKELVNIFNDSGLCTRYKMTIYDAWCAMAVSDAFIALGLTSIFPCVECSCASMITLAQKAGIWVENDAYVPGIADVILYDWDDSGSGDNTGTPDHVGIVQTISGSSFTVIEGNKSDTVGVRSMTVNGRYIRGYITPDYASAASSGAGSTTGGGMSETADPEVVWDYLMSKIANAYGVAGVMGNMYAESAFIPINLQDSYEKKLGYTDKTYTEAVDNGTYANFVSDSAGYGLVQWTFYTLKQGLLDYCQDKKASIGNLDAQLEYLCIELPDEFASLWKTLQNSTSVKEASDAMLTKFENPADQSDSVKEKRSSYGQKYYDMYSGRTASSGGSGKEYAEYGPDSSISGTYVVTTDGLNLRKSAGTDGEYITTLPYGTPVQNYGYYSIVDGVKWLYVMTLDGTVGFMSSKYLSKGTSTGTTTTSLPTYTVGNTYTVQVDHLSVRTGAGTSYEKKAKSQLTSDGQNHAYSDGCLMKGTTVTCQATKTVDGDVWMQIPSGWVAAYYDCEKYIK